MAKDRGVQGYILYLPFGAIKKNLIKFYNKICILGLKFVYIVTYRKEGVAQMRRVHLNREGHLNPRNA